MRPAGPSWSDGRHVREALDGVSFGAEGLADDPRFATNGDRVVHRDELGAALAARLADEPATAWVDLLRTAGIPCGVVHDVAEAFAYARAVGLDPVVRVPRSDGTTVDTVANPLSMSRTPPRYRSAPPRLGEHADQIRAHESRVAPRRRNDA